MNKHEIIGRLREAEDNIKRERKLLIDFLLGTAITLGITITIIVRGNGGIFLILFGISAVVLGFFTCRTYLDMRSARVEAQELRTQLQKGDAAAPRNEESTAYTKID